MKHFLFLLWTFASVLLAAEPLRLQVENLSFTSPADWIDGPVSSPMRKGTWRTGNAPDAAEISFFAFGRDQGGSVSQNIQRWFGQFSGSASKGESATVVVHERTITFARSEGTFSTGLPGAPTTPIPDQALFGAIIETEAGMVFVKMTGPKSTVQKMESAFTALVTNAAKSR